MTFQQYPQKLGIPSGNTSGRPSSPVVGDTYYNGELEILEIWNGSTWVAVSAPPATPSISSVTDASTSDAYTSTAGKLTVVMTPGSGGGTPNQYNAYTTSGGHTASSSSSTVTLTGLTPGTSYTVYGTAQNNFGTTVNSANAAAVTPTTLPQAPTIGTATDTTTGGSLSLTFTAGNSGGKTISNYQYQLNGAGSYTAFSPAQTTSPLTISGLTNGTSYTVKLKAVNANGVSPESSASNSATPTAQVTVGYLVVAGGGGGAAGGGGAGGLRSTVTASGRGSAVESDLTLLIGTNYTVTVGAGGNGTSAYGGTVGNVGSNSVFSTITSTGGGGGGASTNGGNGGCGGGASYSSGQSYPGTGTTGQGYDGGADTVDDAPYPAPGGGGTGSVGGNPPSGATGGAGGNGTAVSITGSSVTYGGGGGGGVYGGGTGGTAGTGGGGVGQTPGNGTTNLGGGGGGAGVGTTGGNGGSGVVILRWLTSQGSITVGAGLTADSTGTDGSYSYKKFTAGSGNVSFS